MLESWVKIDTFAVIDRLHTNIQFLNVVGIFVSTIKKHIDNTLSGLQNSLEV